MTGILLITGGARGIGAANARLAAERGYAGAVNYERARGNADSASRAEGDDGVAPDAVADVPHPVVHGEGWATVVEVDAAAAMGAIAEHRAQAGDGQAADDAAGGPSEEQLAEASAALEALTTPVDGGRALQTSLLSVLLTDDGRVLAGSVPVDALVEYAAESGR